MKVEEIEQRLKDHEERIRKLEVGVLQKTATQTIKKELSIKEFILAIKPKGMTQMSLAIAYYLEKYQDMSSITTEEIANGFKQAKEPLPSNLSMAVYRNIARGFLMEVKEKKNNKKAYSLTSSGERLVENNFKK